MQVVWNLLLFSGKDSVKDNIVGLEFMMDNEVLVVGTESGELFSVSVPTQSVEVVGNVEGGIMQMSASPDGELLAIATGLGMLLLMTSDWEVFYEIPLYDHTQLEVSVDSVLSFSQVLLDSSRICFDWEWLMYRQVGCCESAGARMGSILQL